MEDRKNKIRRLQFQIMMADMRKRTLEKYGLWSATDQAALDNLNKMTEYEQLMELREINRPIIVQPAKKHWQDSIGRYILIGVVIAVIAGVLVAIILNSGFFPEK